MGAPAGFPQDEDSQEYGPVPATGGRFARPALPERPAPGSWYGSETGEEDFEEGPEEDALAGFRQPLSGPARPSDRSTFQRRPVSPSPYTTGEEDVEDEEEDREDEDENGGVEYVPFDDL
jgi:hypothetical protein